MMILIVYGSKLFISTLKCYLCKISYFKIYDKILEQFF